VTSWWFWLIGMKAKSPLLFNYVKTRINAAKRAAVMRKDSIID
jgi:hypothetical protein